MNYYLLGFKKQTARYTKFFKGCAFLKGGEKGDLKFKTLFGFEPDVNYLQLLPKFARFFQVYRDIVLKQDPDAKFIIFNQTPLSYIDNCRNIDCFNSLDLVLFLSHKHSCREFFKDTVNILDHKKLMKYKIDYKKLCEMFENKFDKFVVQAPFGSGGRKTIILTKQNNTRARYLLNKKVFYSVSGYQENAIAVKNTFVLSENDLMVFDGYVQKNKKIFRLENDGFDFDAYKKLSKTARQNILSATKKIAEKLRRFRYCGVGEIEFLLIGDTPYFMEINPRFPDATSQLNKQLTKKGFPCLFEIQVLSFHEPEKFSMLCKKISN